MVVCKLMDKAAVLDTIGYYREAMGYRGNMYHLLATLLRYEPRKSDLEKLSNQMLAHQPSGGQPPAARRLDSLVSEEDAKGRGCGASAQGGAGQDAGSEHILAQYLASLDKAALDKQYLEIRTEYARLFIGPRPPKAPPYESMYRGCPRRLFTETTMAVRKSFQNAGYAVTHKGKEPDDHIGNELELMRELCAAAVIDEPPQEQLRQNVTPGNLGICVEQYERVLENLAMQKGFLDDHLGQWAFAFSDLIQQESDHPFFLAVAQLLADFIEEDTGLVEEMIRLVGSLTQGAGRE